jgi:hypothetical protein
LRRFGDYLFQAAAGALIALAFAGMVFMLVAAGTNTGPNCPGKDPSWIGWCSEAPDHG